MNLIPRRGFWDLDEDWDDDWFERPHWGRMLAPFDEEIIRAPKMDIYEDNGNVVAEAELPGVEAKDVEIEVKDNCLRIEAKKEEKKEEKKKGYYRKEMSRGYFKRIVALPAEVKGEKAEAEYKEGVLRITIPKAESKKKEEKGIKVKIKNK